MNITLFIDSLYGGGAERVACNLANYLSQQGHKVEIIIISEKERKYELEEKVAVYTLLKLKERGNRAWNAFIRLKRFFYYLRTKDVDVYIVMLPATILLLLAFKWLTRAKVIAAERANPASYSKRTSKLLKHYASKADGWVFQTEEAKNWYSDSIRNCKSITIPNAINPAFIRTCYAGRRRKIIASAGRLSDQKNFGLLIKAFAKIAPDFPEYRLVIYGNGDKESELRELVQKLGIRDKVMFPGNIQNIEEEMQKNAMFVLPSNFEGMPNALMEAMALGLPCVSTDCPCGGPRYLIKNGVNGLLVPVGNVDKMANAIQSILANHAKARELGNNAKRIVEQLAPEKIYGLWSQFINEIGKI